MVLKGNKIMAAATLRACAGENGYSPDGRVPVAHNKNKSTECTAQITISSGRAKAIISMFSQRQLYDRVLIARFKKQVIEEYSC